MKSLSDSKYLIICNPRAGPGKAKSVVEKIKSVFSERNLDFKVAVTKRRGDALSIARKSANGHFTHIISVGGDGTSHEIVNGIVDKDVCFGVIPSGSGNDFPKAAGIPLDTDMAIENILNNNTKIAEIGKMEKEYFINGLGIGLDGAVAKRFKSLKKFGAFTGYLIGAVIEAFSFKGFLVTADNGSFSYSGQTLLFGASNGQTQGGIYLAPDADIYDGYLDFHFFNDMNPIKRLITLSKALKANHTNLKEVNLKKLERLTIETDRDLPAHMDGETFVLKSGKHEIEVQKGKLKIIVPKE